MLTKDRKQHANSRTNRTEFTRRLALIANANSFQAISERSFRKYGELLIPNSPPSGRQKGTLNKITQFLFNLANSVASNCTFCMAAKSVYQARSVHFTRLPNENRYSSYAFRAMNGQRNCKIVAKSVLAASTRFVFLLVVLMRLFLPVLFGIFGIFTPLAAQDAVLLSERFAPGYEYRVNTRVDLKGDLSIPVEKDKPAQQVKMTGRSVIDYDERVLPADSKTGDPKTVRQYRGIEFRRLTGDKPQEISLRPEVKRLVVMKRPTAKVAFSPDGPLTWGEIDMLRTDLFVPTLAGLLPNRAVKPGESWRVADAAVAELTDMDKIERGGLTGKFEIEEIVGGRRVAHITYTGELEGVNEDGPNRQKLSCRLYYDIQGAYISYLSINGEHFLLDKDGRENGKVAGEFVMVRQLSPRNPNLAEALLARVSLDPNAENTALLYEEPELGVRLMHPRRWRVTRVARGQITMDETNGSGLLITVEPLTRIPTAYAYMKETQQFLDQQKSKINKTSGPFRLANPPAELDQFAFDAEVGGQRVIMDYLIVRQPNAGATFAARLLENDRDLLVKEVERMARSLTLSRKFEGK